ncbi:MAG: hypothetical protein A2Y25_05805 [Candidatus Melainabacteria bacterium GWF2_37_15]|nr:MAG: hypothetical protein A2Y25_05805 [Candidatus Melainabacteria bacterium GWF2_37_15]
MELKEKIDDIHYESFQRVLQLKIMLKCLEIACCYNDELTTKEIMLFTEVLNQKTDEIESIIDKLSIV